MIDENKCPECGTSDIEYDYDDLQYCLDGIARFFRCEDCGCKYTVVYYPTSLEIIESGNNEE